MRSNVNVIRDVTVVIYNTLCTRPAWSHHVVEHNVESMVSKLFRIVWE